MYILSFLNLVIGVEASLFVNFTFLHYPQCAEPAFCGHGNGIARARSLEEVLSILS